MADAVVKQALDNIRSGVYHTNAKFKNNIDLHEEKLSEKIKKYIIKSIQISIQGAVSWGLIIEEYNEYGVNYNIMNNFMVYSQEKKVKEVSRAIENKVKNDGEFAAYIFKRKKEIFILSMWIRCDFTQNQFEKFLNNAVDNFSEMMRMPDINKLYSIDSIDEKTNNALVEFVSKKIKSL